MSHTNKIVFDVQGSAAEPYQVTFMKKDKNLTAWCTCPAAENGQYCKHRFSIMQGENSSIVSSNKTDVGIILEWLVGSDVESALKKVKRLEEDLEKAKHNLYASKKKLARMLRD